LTISKEEIRSGLTIKAFVVSLVGLIVGLIFGAQNGRFFGYYFEGVLVNPINTYKYNEFHHWMGVTPLVALGYATFFGLLVASINAIRKRNVFSRQELAVIFTATFWSFYEWDLYTCPFQSSITQEGGVLLQPPEIIGVLSNTIPPIWKSGLSEAIWSRMLFMPYFSPERIHFAQLPWGNILPPTLWIITTMTFFCFIFLFSVMLVRFVWFTIEYLVSPPAEFLSSVINYTQIVEDEHGEKKVPFFKNKYFIIPFIVLFIYTFINYGEHWAEGLIYYYTSKQTLADATNAVNIARSNLGGIAIGAFKLQLMPNFEFTQLAILPWVPMLVNLAPHWIAWGLLMPTRILGNYIVSSLAVWFIWPIIMVGAGIWPTMPTGTTSSTVFSNRMSGAWSGHSLHMMYMGLLFGLAIMPIVLNWKRISPIFKAIYQKEPPDFDPEKPFSYRWIWLGLIISFFAWLVLIQIMAPIPIGSLIIWLALSIILTLGSARLILEAGGFYGYPFQRMFNSTPGWLGYYILKGTGIIPRPEPDYTSVVSVYLFQGGMHGSITNIGLLTPAMTSIPLRAGSLVRTSTKSQLITLIWAIPVVFVTAGILFWFYITEFAPAANPAGKSAWWNAVTGAIWRRAYEDVQRGTDPSFVNAEAHPEAAFSMLVAGLIISVLIPILQIYIPRLASLSVAAISLGVFTYQFIWSWLIAMIIKVIVLRVGGLTLYDNKLRPIALGIFAGTMLGVFITMVPFQFWMSHIMDRGF